MTPTLTITDGSSTVQLSNSTNQIIEYLPQVADGTNNVTESARIIFDSSTATRAALVSLNRLFEQARIRQKLHIGPQVYAKYSPSSLESPYRSEILDGRCAIDDPLARQLIISWTRRYFWESDSEYALGMTNDLITMPATTLTFNNANRGSYANVARISGSSIGGDIPTPARMVLTNTYNSADSTRDYYIGHWVELNGQLPHMLECDTGTVYNGSSIVSQNAVLSASTTSGNLVWSKPMPSGLLAAARGGMFRLLAKTDTVSGVAGLYLKAKISIDLVSTQYDGEWVAVPTAGAGVLDLGAVQLPPNGVSGATVYPLTLELHAKHTGTSSTIPVDFVQVTPTRSYRVLKARGFSTGYGVSLHDNPVGEALYTDGWVNGQLANYTAIGDPIMLVPGKTNALYLLTVSADVVRTTTLQVFYRPRRLII